MSAHTEIKSAYDRLNEKILAKHQQGLSAGDVPLTLKDGKDLLTSMLHLAEELAALKASTPIPSTGVGGVIQDRHA